MKKIFFLFAAVMSLLAVGCRDVLLEKNTGGFSVSFQTPGSSSRAGTTATWKLEAWLELESGDQLQKKDDTVPADAPITITFDAVPIGTKLKVQVRLEDKENSLIQHEGSSDWITVDAESKTVEVQVQRKIVNAAAPSITTQPAPQTEDYQAGDEVNLSVTLTVVADSPDGGKLSYEWYENTANSNSGGTLIPEATEEAYQVTLTPGETKYFYCVVTNTNDAVNGTKTATTTSNVAKIVYNIAIAQSGVLLWDSASVKIAPIDPYGNYDFDAATSVLNSKVPPVWCFDNTGNLYVVLKDGGGIHRYDLQVDGTYPLSASANYSYQDMCTTLSYDKVEKKLYVLDSNTPLYELTDSGSQEVIGGDPAQNLVGLAVHNNIAYIAQLGVTEGQNGELVLSLVKYDLPYGGNTKSGDEMVHHQLPVSFGTFADSITGQMIYQDGALYLLLGSFSVSSSTTDTEVQSCGALLRINPSTLTLDTSFGSNGYLGLASERTISGTYNSDQYSMKLYSPTASDESRAFYGPVGFVAVMPKKLVIADAGYDLSKGSGDKLLASRKNRVVTVNLETQAFDVASLSDTTFYGNIISSCGFLVVEE